MESKSVLNYLLSFFLLLTIVAYFLGESGKVNNFPTYVLGLLVLYGVSTSRDVRLFIAESRVLQLCSLLLCYFAVSAFWSTESSWSEIGIAFGNVALVLAFLLAIVICSRTIDGFLPIFLRLFVLSACVSAVYSIYLYFTYHLLPFHEDRIYALGRLGSPVKGALSYGAASLIALHLLLNSGDRVKLLGWALVETILLYTIHKTGTISVWVGLLPAWIVLLSLYVKAGPRQIILWLLLALVISALCVTGLFYMDRELFTAIFPRAGSYRPEIWSMALSLTIDHNMLFGFGQLDSGDLTYQGESFHHAHSIYIANFYYGGLVGLLLLLALVGKMFGVVLPIAFDREAPDPVGLQSHSRLSGLTDLSLTAMVFACIVFAFDGDHLLAKVGLVWMVFWLPVGLAALVEIRAKSSGAARVASGE